jgi:2-alkenal reductase
MQRKTSLWIGLASMLLIGVLLGGFIAGGAAYLLLRGSTVLASGPVASLARNIQQVTPSTQAAGSVQSAQSTQSTQAQVPSPDAAVVNVVKKTSPAVVTVINVLQPSSQPNQLQRDPFQFPFPNVPQQPQPQQPAIASGSGVIISNDGYIVTNNHVVDNEQSLAVIYADGSRHEATLVGTDPVMDIAVIRVKDPVPGVASFGDSDALQPGETAIAIGSPLGDFQNSVTVGVVSALNRTVPGSGMEGLVQTDAAINHGNSGGPLINLNGEVIGINTLVVRSDSMAGDQAQGLGFAIPSNTVKDVSQQLIANGKVVYPYLGVRFSEIDPETAALQNLPVQYGALVGQVQPNTPAAQAGLQQNDIITAINGQKLDGTSSLRQLLLKHKPGDTVQLEVLRNGKTITVDVKLGTRPANLQQ